MLIYTARFVDVDGAVLLVVGGRCSGIICLDIALGRGAQGKNTNVKVSIRDGIVKFKGKGLKEVKCL